MNEFRFGFGRSEPGFPMQSTVLGPRITFSDASVNNFGPWEGLPQGRSQNTWQFTDNVTLVHGAHNLKAGIRVLLPGGGQHLRLRRPPALTFANWADFPEGRR